MGCFCRHVPVPPAPPPDSEPADEPRAPPVIPALSAALAARWLPATVPWAPDPEWLQLQLPAVAMPASAVATLIGLVNARAAILTVFKLDPLQPAQLAQLARVVNTLNRRMPLLGPMAEDPQPWSALALVNDQVDTVQAALEADPPAHPPPLPTWRPLLAQMMPLLPVIAIVNLLELDVRDPPAALKRLATTIRELRRVVLPPLANPHRVMQIIARNEAVARVQNSFGPVPFAEARDQVARKVQSVLRKLPPGLSVDPAGVLSGLPDLWPNPSVVINAATVAAAKQLNAPFMAGLNWNVPAQPELPLLAVGAPVAALVGGMTRVDPASQPVRRSPCDGHCDARAA